MKFIVDQNVGKLTRWLRLLGYDTVFFTGEDDWEMIIRAQKEDRVVLTRDSEVMRRGIIAKGVLKALFITSERPEEQLRQVITDLGLDVKSGLFTLCLVDNVRLEPIEKDLIKEQVPAYVFSTQDRFYQCPNCRRIYWKGTHWKAMKSWLDNVSHF